MQVYRCWSKLHWPPERFQSLFAGADELSLFPVADEAILSAVEYQPAEGPYQARLTLRTDHGPCFIRATDPAILRDLSVQLHACLGWSIRQLGD